jgi:hypothetical protein
MDISSTKTIFFGGGGGVVVANNFFASASLSKQFSLIAVDFIIN